MSLQYGELRLTSGWDRFVSLGHPCKFQRVSHLVHVTARHSSIGRQPNFAALNRERHLYSAGRPSRWALAHISSLRLFFSCVLDYKLCNVQLKFWITKDCTDALRVFCAITELLLTLISCMKTAELFVTEATLVSVFRRATLAILAKLQSTLSTLLNIMLVCLRNLRFTF